MRAIPTISSPISTAWEAQNDNASIPLDVLGALLGDAVRVHAASRPSALSAHPARGQRTAELADLFRQLQFTALFGAQPDQPPERESIATAWMYQIRRPGVFEASPIVVDGIMYI